MGDEMPSAVEFDAENSKSHISEIDGDGFTWSITNIKLATQPITGDDEVEHPAHYTHGDVECIDAIESALGDGGFAAFCRGNAIKYMWRAGLKGDAETDYRKARWYIDRLIEDEED